MRRPDLLQPPVSAPSRPASDTGSAAARCARPAPGSAATAAWRRASRVLAVELAHPYIHVCRSPQNRPALLGRKLQGLLVGAHGLAEPALRTPYIRQRDRAAEGVGDVPGPPQPRHALGIPGVPGIEVPARPGREPHECRCRSRPRWSSAGESSSARRACRAAHAMQAGWAGVEVAVSIDPGIRVGVQSRRLPQRRDPVGERSEHTWVERLGEPVGHRRQTALAASSGAAMSTSAWMIRSG